MEQGSWSSLSYEIKTFLYNALILKSNLLFQCDKILKTLIGKNIGGRHTKLNFKLRNNWHNKAGHKIYFFKLTNEAKNHTQNPKGK